MTVRIRLIKKVPKSWLVQWSEATNSEAHLTPESPDSLADNLLIAAVAVAGSRPVGFGGLIIARTNDGHSLNISNQLATELGGAYILPEFRGQGLWKRLAIARIRFATKNDLRVVCITGNPIVQTGLKQIGASPMSLTTDKVVLEALCLECEARDSCGYCPMQPHTSWLVV